ncbi:septation protein A [Steroidobacter denitrificans]|uniref:Inner membrane-spanning protein YciB n=1 Tax=Steroidobacter denitrificans TaxID=465721 RepID=A0A127F8U4_STEDE|nr:septation protein A [Steroidobacter denitrificans]AMN46853.1 septation protein A [Steroidobacter denitrificans]
MQLLFDFFPVIAFFVAYKLAGIYAATVVIIAAVIVQSAIQWIRHRKLSSMALISGALVLVFGGLTLWIQDEMFIKWKVTVVNWLFAGGFLLSHYVGTQPVIQRMLGASLQFEHGQLEREQWLKLSWMWIGFFLLLGVSNLYVAYRFSTDIWVAFKLYGVLGLTLVFALLQGMWLAARMPVEPRALQDGPSSRPAAAGTGIEDPESPGAAHTGESQS